MQSSSTAYGAVAAVYDALMADVPHGAWLTRIERELRNRSKTPISVLDVACGTGIASEILYERGYRPVVGFDLAAEMIKIARTKAMGKGYGEELIYHVQNAANLDLGDERFDLAVSLFDSLNYILDPNELAAAIQQVYGHLKPGGVFAFDVNSLYALSHNLFTQTGESGPVQHIWYSEWDRETRTCRVEMDFTVTDPITKEERQFHETHLQRAYTITELRDFLEAAGFTDIAVYGNYGDRTPGPRSDRLLFVAERPT